MLNSSNIYEKKLKTIKGEFTITKLLILFSIVSFFFLGCISQNDLKKDGDSLSYQSGVLAIDYQELNLPEDDLIYSDAYNYPEDIFDLINGKISSTVVDWEEEGESWFRTGDCSLIEKDMGVALEAIYDDVAYAKKILDTFSYYKVGSDPRMWMGDMGCSPGLDIHSGYHDTPTTVDTLFYLTGDHNCSQWGCRGNAVSPDLYPYPDGQLDGSEIDWIRMLYFYKRVYAVFPSARAWLGNKLTDFLVDKIRYHHGYEDIFKQLNLDNFSEEDLESVIYRNDEYNHTLHSHLQLRTIINYEAFTSQDWFYDNKEIEFFALEECQNSSCKGFQKILFPVSNEAGEFLQYPFVCRGNYHVKTYDAYWDFTCDTEIEQLDYCPESLEDSTTACPYIPNDTPREMVKTKCIDSICSGENISFSNISNGDNKTTFNEIDPYETLKYCCDGRVDLNVKGSNWEVDNACSTGWYYAKVTYVLDFMGSYSLTFEDCLSGTTPNPVIEYFTVDGEEDITVSVGDIPSYKWNVKYATSVISYNTVDEDDNCGYKKDTYSSWIAKTMNGESSDIAIDICQAGRTYPITIEASNSSGTTTKTISVKVLDYPKPTFEYYTVNGEEDTTVYVGDIPSYKWSVKDATSVISYFTVDKDDTCGNKVNNQSGWVAQTTSGESSYIAIKSCQAGVTYTITMEASNTYGTTTKKISVKVF